MNNITELAQSLSTTELETLISDLMELRATMNPPVPYDPPKPGGDCSNISVQDEPYLQARRLRDGRIRLWLRNAGIGWMVFNLTHEQSATLRDFLIANTDTQSALFSEEDAGGNAPH